MAANQHDAVREKRKKFRELIFGPRCHVQVGGFSPLYAKMAERAGFESFFFAGSQMSAFLLGVPDNGFIGLRDVVDHVRHAAAICNIPIFVDCDTGYGNAVNADYAVREVIRAGVAALQLEDQEAPKKSAIEAGRRCVSKEEHIGKLRAAVAARNEMDPEFVICARCDSLGAEDGGFDDALERCIDYVTKGGADFIWLNSCETREQLKRACKEIPAPVFALWANTVEPAPANGEYEDLGACMIQYPTVAATWGLQASWEKLNDIREMGRDYIDDRAVRKGKVPSKWGPVEQQLLVGTKRIREIEEKFLTDDAKRDYDSTWGH
jgi:2-methylisocitrate lyase-like PEP mutase family enzyme